MLLYGDPILLPDTKAFKDYKKDKEKAELLFRAGHQEAFEAYSKCLNYFGLKLPSTTSEIFICTTWQIIRMLFQMFTSQIFARIESFFLGKDYRKKALESAKELSLIYHRLNQISLSKNIYNSTGLLLAVSATNLVDTLTAVNNSKYVSEVYIVSAMQIKKAYPKLLRVFCR